MSTTPYNWTPEKHQMPVIKHPARFKVIVWHRKAHKTTLAVNELLRWANAISGTYWYVAPQLNQARKIVWEDPEMLQKYCPPEIWAKRNNSGLFLQFPNGSKLYILGADTPDSLRGPNPRGVILDEYDDHHPEIWQAVIQPIMMANPEAWCWFVGTYKGRKDLLAKYNYALQEMKDKMGTSRWFATLLKASESGIIALQDLEEAKRTTTEAYFNQEYECDPIENAAAVFRNLENCLEVIDDHTGLLKPWDGNLILSKQRNYVIGADLAKFNDFTVITPFDLTSFRVGKPDRFNQVDYNLIKAKIELAHLRYNKAFTRIDGTGVGTPVYDDLSKKIQNLESFVFTERSRWDLLTNLQIMIEQGKIRIPNDPQLLAELRGFQYSLSHAGEMGKRAKIKIEVPNGMHDDCVMSLALAVWNAPDKPMRERPDESERELLKQFDSRKGSKSGIFTGSRYLNQ